MFLKVLLYVGIVVGVVLLLSFLLQLLAKQVTKYRIWKEGVQDEEQERKEDSDARYNALRDLDASSDGIGVRER